MLTADEALDLIETMAGKAEEDMEKVSDFDMAAAYWEGWWQGLRTLAAYIKTDVKATCLPIGSCECHQSRFVKA